MSDNLLPQKTTLKASLLLDTRSVLGEGAIWNDVDQKLYWVDIDPGLLHWFDPLTVHNETAVFNQKISTVVPTQHGNLLVALKDGIYSYKKASNQLDLVVSNPENDSSGNRFNDGKCDPSGRLWVGTMGDEQSAHLYRVDPDQSIHTMKTQVSTSNGLVWSPDKKKMYYIDTSTHKVVAYDYDDQSGQISNPADAIIIPDDMGKPDGSTIDSEGMIWIALWGGYAVTRWNPKTGALLCKVKVASKNVTSCAFGGKNLDTLYITTARTKTSEEELKLYPNSGGLFMIKPGVTGVKTNHFSG
ncbi:SMP-30/gluconolactonase/LRE family protein [Pedobacter nyackensis]|uniref:Sugar lactone lactonase YvrE n=1 Tax=Pedobacter nyackensis TaxID=475255 RepID=A0A1W1ZUK9_9SPHI|nr:SMP-30/gluconolactonase/LRE family protein [Pedobacter nyackensis]SMC51791.1 Sugar lactone lactonase YvrE [Pedobacter nyackensis]